VHVILQIESKVDYLLCPKYVNVLLILLFTIVHLFVDLLLSTPMITTLMWLVFVVVIANMMWFEFDIVVVALMLDQSDPHVFP
jgi:hypothetical protein